MFEKPGQKIRTRQELLSVLYSLGESQSWHADDFSEWATDLLLQVDDPSRWLMNLVSVCNRAELDEAIMSGFCECKVRRPDWAHDLTAGFLIARWKSGSLSEYELRCELGGIADGYMPWDFTIEETIDMNLAQPRFGKWCKLALSLLPQLRSNPASIHLQHLVQ